MQGAIATGLLLACAGTVLADDNSVVALVSSTANDHLGFVVTRFMYVLGPDADKSDACPDGLTKGVTEIFKESPGGAQGEGESDKDYNHRIQEGAKTLSTAPNGQNMCLNPEAGSPEPHFRIVKGSNVALEGLDLDGQFSKARGKAAPNTCAHDDFKSIDGKSGIDNQFYRAVGCSKSYQSTGPSNTFDTEMLTGSWGILLTLKNVGDGRNAQNVEVGIYANADPIELSPTREPLAHATYAMDQDPRFRASTHGRIVNGVLTTDPVDVRFHWIVNSIHLERPLQDARIRATISPDGVIEGFMAGYSPVEDIYDVQFGFRSGKDAKGDPANPRLVAGSSNGAAFVLDHTCNGAYYALKQLADGHRDPKTGMCTSISTQYKFKAVPAFVVDAATQSANAELDRHGTVDPYRRSAHDSKDY
jgi:hypothetical protein